MKLPSAIWAPTTAVRWFNDLHYAARSWNKKRQVIAKIEYTSKGSNPRYVFINLITTVVIATGLISFNYCYHH